MTDLRNVVCVGGGPAGLYFAILLKRAMPHVDVTVHERNVPGSATGWGVVLSANTLGHLRAADETSFQRLEDAFVRWDELEVRWRGERRRTVGHEFIGIHRQELLQRLVACARETGVNVRHESSVESADQVASADLVVVCEGARSTLRDAVREEFGSSIEVGEQRYFWVGTDHVFDNFAFIFEDSEFGIFQAHAYAHSKNQSTLSFVVSNETLERAGLLTKTPEECGTFLGELFAKHLEHRRILVQQSVWGRFRTVRCARWVHRNFVLMGDTAHTAHFTIGSGTKMALEDAVALRDALTTEKRLEDALAAYERVRRPIVERTQSAAAANLAFVYYPERFRALDADQFAFRLVTRSGRLLRDGARRRDPTFVDRVERAFAQGSELAPESVPVRVGGAELPGRLIAGTPESLGAFNVVYRRVTEGPANAAATSSGSKTLRAALVDSAALATAGVEGLLEPTRACDPDLVVVDATVETIDGAMAAERIRHAVGRPTAVRYRDASPDLVASLLLGGRADLVILDPSLGSDESRP